VDGIRHHERVAPVLVHEVVRLAVRGVRQWIVKEAVDGDDLAQLIDAGLFIRQIFHRDEKNAINERSCVNRRGELHSKSGIQVEAVKIVEHLQVRARSGLDLAIRQGHIHADAGFLGRIGDGEVISGEGSDARFGRVELNHHGRHQDLARQQ
jgi:hypothetical protein